MFHPKWREHSLAKLDRGFDVVVIGAGITGCGIALDAAQRGLRTLLMDKGDIASGTSSRSSKLIHGGLRYLKQMQLRMTRLACRERDRMLNLSPHLVTPIRFLYPAYHGDLTPGWQVDLGLWMYDQLTGRPEKHSQLSAEEVRGLVPGLKVQGLDRALSYTDAMADDARLTLAVAATAHNNGCAVLSRCEVLEAERDSEGRVIGLVLQDHESGNRQQVRAQAVINASGVWTDAVRERLGLPGSRMRPSRGIHLILPHEVLSISAAVTLPSPDDGRPVFLIPHPEGILLGTTDRYHEGDLDDPRPSAAEVDYLLRAATSGFPRITLGRTHVRAAFAGLRPILDTHAEDPSEASREEDIWEEDGVLSVTGGKLTTWRQIAEETVDQAIDLLMEDRAPSLNRCATKGTPLAGLAPRDLDLRLTRGHGIEAPVSHAMARRLSSMAWPAMLLSRSPRELQPLADGLDLCAAELRAHLRWNAVLHLEDLLIRRVRLGMWQPEVARELAPKLRPYFADELGWDNSRWDNEEEAFNRTLEAWTLAGVR